MKKLFRTTSDNLWGIKLLCLCFIGIINIFLANQAIAQNRWSAAFRPGINFPVISLGKIDLNTGHGYSGIVSFRFMEHLYVYTGWGWNRFYARPAIAESKTRFDENGQTFGFQF